MTTSSANNSVFRGFFEKQKLTGPNFIDWYRQLRIVLSIEDKLNYLEQPLPPAPVAPAGQQVAPEILAAHTAWVKGSKEIVGLMLMTMEPEIQRNLENLHANDMLKELKTLFAQQAEQELLQTTRDFHSCKQEEGQSVSSYVLKMKGYIDNLERLGHPVTLGLAVSLILIGLRKEFDGFVQNYNMHSLGKTVNELHAMVKAPMRKVSAQKKQQHSYSTAISSVVSLRRNTGIMRNCPQYLAELLKKKKNAAGGSEPSRHWTLLFVALSSWTQSQETHEKFANTMELLNSTDLRAFEKCVPCMSGKMARKPYTHQVERAKDLLGLIHTDVCGPFKITSRQGANYFVTFTDDFSRYGYVYLLKHKHEVFETFKVFQKEVENQLGKTIKSLRSDRGGEYMSQEFLDHLKDHGIIAHRTPPYTPQHNGVSERRNRTLLDMVRSMMSQTTLPKSFWDYALETAARILNMVPTKKVEKTPYEVWHGQAPKLSYLKGRGCLINQEASGSLEDLEIIQEEDTHPSIDTSLNHEEDDLEMDEPQSDIIPIQLGEPANYKAALLDPEFDKWLNVMNVE
ncbi:retrotransposon protein, putative, ty1-copia subclass [Tanacetum coccineum]